MLNREEKFVKKIIETTKNSVLKWNASTFAKYSDMIENSHRGIRIFESESLSALVAGDLSFQNRNLVLYEIKKINYHAELEEYYESKAIILMLINSLNKEQTFDATTISKDILCELMDAVANSVYDTDSFINFFETNQ